MATLIEKKGFDAASLEELLKKFKETYGSIQDIIDTIETTPFSESAETEVDTTHTIKYIGESGLNTILQLIKEIKENCNSQFAAIESQLTAINGGISSLSDVVEVMNEDVNDLVETSASHTASINEITTWINEFNDKITE